MALSWTVAAAAQTAAAAPRDDPFARRRWHLELGGAGAVEAWNYNISHEDLIAFVPGLTYGLRDGLVFGASWPMYYVVQRGSDSYVLAGTFGVRGRVYGRQRWSVYLEGRLGVSQADTIVPPRGTRFNFLAIGGGGITARLSKGVHGFAGVDLTHISNAGREGDNRNPDIEAIGPKFGVLIAF
jgi:hypothetical protein